MDREAAISSLLAPRVVAHVGASETGIYPSGIFRCLMDSDVKAYPVNPNRKSVFEVPCFPSVRELPERPDLAVITVPRALVPAVLGGCVERGIPSAVVVTAGFAEAASFDPVAARLEAQVEELGKRILILGPNCAGLANFSRNVVAARLLGRTRKGGISFVSQSGALMMAMHGSFISRGAGLRCFASVGNQASFIAEELLLHLAKDRETRVLAAFLEGLRDGELFTRALIECRNRGKPIVILKSGRTESGQRLAATHTAAMASEDRVFAAVCRQYGAILVDDIDDFVSTASLLEKLDCGHLKGIAYLSQSGGLGSLTGDLAAMAGMRPEAFPESFAGELVARGILPSSQALLNPVDLGGDAMRSPAIAETMAPFLESRDIGVLVILFAKSPGRTVEEETARAIIEAEKKHGKPIIVVWVGGTDPEEGLDARRTLAAGGIQVFDSPGQAIRALARASAFSPAGKDGGRNGVPEGGRRARIP